MMRRSFVHILLAAASLLTAAVSCDLTGPEHHSTGIEDHCIELTFGGVTPPSIGTKAGMPDIKGEDPYNENLIETVDCFFYAGEDTTHAAVFTALGRAVEAVAEGDSTVYKVKVYFTDGDAQKMFGSTTAGTCRAFVVCNAPLSYGSDTSADALRELVVENDFTGQVIQNSFVMSAEQTGVVTLSTVGDNRSATGRLHVTRAAAKMRMYMYIPETLTDERNREWHFVRNMPIEIQVVSAVKRGKLEGDYTVQTDDYVTYSMRTTDSLAVADRVEGMEDYYRSHVPFYSYPNTWTDLSEYATQYVMRIPWRVGDSEGYMYRKYQMTVNIGRELRRNHYYRTFVKISTIGGAEQDQDVVVPECSYIVTPWLNESTTAGQGLVPGDMTAYKYLVIDEPEVTLNNEETAKFTYVTSSPLKNVKIDKVVFYNNKKASPRDSVTTGWTYTKDLDSLVTSKTASGVTTNIKVIVNKETPGLVTFTHSLGAVYSAWEIYATITNDDNCTQSVKIVQNPSIRLERLEKAGDVFVNGFFGHVDGATFGGTHRPYLRYHSTSGQDTKSYYHTRIGWNEGTAQVVIYNYNSTYQTGLYGTVTGGFYNLDETISRDFFTTLINISSFVSDNHGNQYNVSGEGWIDYRIGDPRVKVEDDRNYADNAYLFRDGQSWETVTNFYKYLKGESSATVPIVDTWERPNEIMITSQKKVDQNLIAPRFLVSSALNSTQTATVTYSVAAKRAATYQEAGYPAGRWRLPTEAEMAFIISRQNDGTIPNLYATGTKYWSASGRLLEPQSGGTISFSNDDGSGHSARFVYDLWYWGDEPSTTNVYHPNGHIYDYDSEGNATLR